MYYSNYKIDFPTAVRSSTVGKFQAIVQSNVFPFVFCLNILTSEYFLATKRIMKCQ